MTSSQHDFVVIGSSFGGSVAALRLTERVIPSQFNRQDADSKGKISVRIPGNSLYSCSEFALNLPAGPLLITLLNHAFNRLTPKGKLDIDTAITGGNESRDIPPVFHFLIE